MRISNLKIRNFRSIQNLDIHIPQICALVGPNNSGKSNILEALKRVLERDWITVNNFSEKDVFGYDSERDLQINVNFDNPIEYKKFKYADPTEVYGFSFKYTRYKTSKNEGKRRLEQSCLNAKGFAPMVPQSAPKKGVKPQFEPLLSIPMELKESVPLVYIGTRRSFSDHLPSSRYSLLRRLIEDIDEDLNKSEEIIEIKQEDGSTKNLSRVEYFNSLMKQALNQLRTSEFTKLEKAIKSNVLQQLGFDPEVDVDQLDFFFAPFSTIDFYKSLDIIVKEGSFKISATELGEGFQNAIVLAILRAYEERRKSGAIMLIEEPEMFLHPQMQRSLYKTLREIGKTNQVIYTTHSSHFVTIPDCKEVLIVRKDEEGTNVKSSSLELSTKDKSKMIKELDPERNELFFANRLLLVEGDTEKLAFPEYAKRLELDLDREGATIVEVGGKGNLEYFANIAISFNIPTGIVFDLDASDYKDKRDEEKAINEDLNKRDNGKDIRVWPFDKKYEDHLRTAIGEEKYQELSQKFGKNKVYKARMIAMEKEIKIPEPVEEILLWLANKQR